jgi:hypothetical protein
MNRYTQSMESVYAEYGIGIAEYGIDIAEYGIGIAEYGTSMGGESSASSAGSPGLEFSGQERQGGTAWHVLGRAAGSPNALLAQQSAPQRTLHKAS